MNLCPVLAAISGEKFGFWFLIFVGILIAGIFFEAWRRKSLFAFYIALFFGSAAWFTSPFGSGLQRSITAIAVLALGAALLWIFRRQKLRAVGVVLGTLLTLIVIFLSSPQANYVYFEILVGKMWTFSLATAFAAVCLLYILPRLDQKRHAGPALLLAGLGCFGMTACALAWWFTAVEMNVYPENPVVRTEAGLAAEYERTKNLPTDRGVFLIGKLSTADKWPQSGAPPSGNSMNDFVAYYETRRLGFSVGSSRQHPHFPLWFDVTLEDGSISQVRGITSVRQAFNWKEGGPHNFMVCLRPGDPVVMWGRPVKSKGMLDGKEHIGLQETRLVAQGSLEEFQNDFLLPGRTTARLYGWIGFAMLGLSLLVIVPGIVKFLHLRKHGREDPLPPGYKSIKQQWNEQMAEIRKKR